MIILVSYWQNQSLWCYEQVSNKIIEGKTKQKKQQNIFACMAKQEQLFF
jgi:hypothetical protein